MRWRVRLCDLATRPVTWKKSKLHAFPATEPNSCRTLLSWVQTSIANLSLAVYTNNGQSVFLSVGRSECVLY